MKKYFVGVNTGRGIVQLVSYDSKDLASPQNPNGVRYVNMFSDNYYNLMYEDTSKKRCLQYVKQNLSQFELWDCSK